MKMSFNRGEQEPEVQEFEFVVSASSETKPDKGEVKFTAKLDTRHEATIENLIEQGKPAEALKYLKENASTIEVEEKFWEDWSVDSDETTSD